MPTSAEHFSSGYEGDIRRRRHRTSRVAGPYRSQSSNPQIRSEATQHEHRRVRSPLDGLDHVVEPLSIPSLPTAPTLSVPSSVATQLGVDTGEPQTAFDLARFQGIQPAASRQQEWREDYGPGVYGQIQEAALQKLASEENLGEPADLTNLALLIGTGGGSLALRGALKAAGVAEGATAAESALQGTGKLATALRGAAKVGSFPLRHPIISSGAPLAAQAPIAGVKGDPGELSKGLEGTGVLADVLSGAGGAVRTAIPGLAGNTLADALSLPAQVLPSAYLTGKAGVEAAAGDPQELQQLIHEYGETSALPALLSGNLGEAASRTEAHPLYTALEAAAIKSGVGRGAGDVARRLRIPGAQHEMRPDLIAYGDVARQQGPYSNDLITRHFQRRADERRPIGPHGEKLLRPNEASKHLRSALDREVFAGEQVRRGNQRQVSHELEEVKPQDKAQADVVSHAIQGIARNPDRAIFDLQSYRDKLIEQQPNLTASELTANRKQIEVIDNALANPNPDAIFNAAQTFIDQQAPITQGLVERGLLDPDQARKAIAIPYARTHMDAGYGLSRADRTEESQIREAMKEKGLDSHERGQLLGALSRIRAKSQTLSAAGDPLPLDAIEKHMTESGVAPRGFVTQRPAPASGAASFFQPPNERASLPRQRRSGEATTRGTFDPKWDAVVQQAIHGRTILDRVNNFEHLVDRFGLRSPDGRSFKDSAEAKRAAEHPEDFNMRLPDIPGGWKPMRLSPWLAKKSEVEAASHLGRNNALEADQPEMIENFSADALKNALEPGDGPVVLMPKVITDRMREHFAQVGPGEKAMQAATGAFKGAVLPTSPKWLAGNLLDNYVIRAFGTGITPHDMLTGRRFARLFKELSPEDRSRALESIVPGGLYGSYARIQPHRSLDQFVGTKIEGLARAAHAVLTAPGVRTASALYRRYRDTVFEFDSKYIEQTPQYGQLAKSARREIGMTRRQFRKAVAAQDQVVMDLVRGFRNPEHVDRFAKEIETVFGQWGKNGPAARRFFATYMPFWMWGRAALRFAFVTLPKDHPVLTGLIAASEQMTREERQKYGLDKAGEEPLPGFLQGGIPDPLNPSGGGVTALGGLTTFGTFNDVPQFAAQLVVPQISSGILAGLGIDWKGDQLVDAEGRPAGELERIKAAAFSTLDAFIPFLNVGRAISERGPGGISPVRTYPKSTVDYLRSLHNTQEINVPISDGGSSSGNPLDALDNALEGGSNPLDQLDKQLEGLGG